jgi:hypothetical protein
MMATDGVISWLTVLAVLGVAAVAAMASYEHAYDLVRALAAASTASTRQSVPESLTDSERSGSCAVGSRLPQVRYEQVLV